VADRRTGITATSGQSPRFPSVVRWNRELCDALPPFLAPDAGGQDGDVDGGLARGPASPGRVLGPLPGMTAADPVICTLSG
jgi:hypothetical protein